MIYLFFLSPLLRRKLQTTGTRRSWRPHLATNPSESDACWPECLPVCCKEGLRKNPLSWEFEFLAPRTFTPQFLVFKENSFLPEIILPSRDAKKPPTKSIKEIWVLKSHFFFFFPLFHLLFLTIKLLPMLSGFLDRSCTTAVCGEAQFFKIKIVQPCHS